MRRESNNDPTAVNSNHSLIWLLPLSQTVKHEFPQETIAAAASVDKAHSAHATDAPATADAFTREAPKEASRVSPASNPAKVKKELTEASPSGKKRPAESSEVSGEPQKAKKKKTSDAGAAKTDSDAKQMTESERLIKEYIKEYKKWKKQAKKWKEQIKKELIKETMDKLETYWYDSSLTYSFGGSDWNYCFSVQGQPYHAIVMFEDLHWM